MDNAFFARPILNSPYEYPGQHWELTEDGQPTGQAISRRRSAKFVTPVPRPKKQAAGQASLVFGADGLSTAEQQYDPTPMIDSLRAEVDRWRLIPNPADWGVTPETARLLQHWRSYPFNHVRPFFCQVEAVETLIWLTEVAPHSKPFKAQFLDHLDAANAEANPGLPRLALKLATGAGKTTVMAMIIAWQTLNAARHPQSGRFTRGFLVVTPGITIRDRLQVLQPNDPYSYYASRELVPLDLLPEMGKAKIVITNRHAFGLREKTELAKGTRSLLQGRGPALQTQETEGQMLQRVMPDLLNLKSLLVLNDEAHHCYRMKPGAAADKLAGDEREEAEKRNEAARQWITGLDTVGRHVRLSRVVDLSATPFFLAGSGYAEGTLFPWTMSDFSLMDAIECGIVKLPRVPVADNIPTAQVPVFRELWPHIQKQMPKKGRAKATGLDPLALPAPLLTALDALYSHYEKTFALWQQSGVKVPPCFIVVCNNTAASKLVYDYIAGYTAGEAGKFIPAHLKLFSNYDDEGRPLARPRTLLIDSEQLESGEALDDAFRKAAADEIARFRDEIRQRTGDPTAGEKMTDADLLREAMNTVGKEGRLGEQIRCVVSVAMLTEGWDANTVTHILGVRAFGTQLLCEQVIGRALRRQSYDLNDDGRFNPEYADVLGIPFNFTDKPVDVKPQPPAQTTRVHAVRPERDALEIRFPRVTGYRTEPPTERLQAEFGPDLHFTLTPEMIGPTATLNAGIVGEQTTLTPEQAKDMRIASVAFHLTKYLLETRWRDTDGAPEIHRFGELKTIALRWLNECFKCVGGTLPGQLLVYKEMSEIACEKIMGGITKAHLGTHRVLAETDPYNPTGSTAFVNFTTSRQTLWLTDPRRCHLNKLVYDSGWEAEFCRVAEAHPLVRAYVKNHNLGFVVPYRLMGRRHDYLPDFILRIDDGRGENDLLNLIVETKGYRGEDAKAKKETMETYWIPGVNHVRTFGRWAFAELTEPWGMSAGIDAGIEADFDKMVRNAADHESGHE